MFNDAISEYEDYLVPQFVGEDYENSFWAWAVKINEKDAWHEFRKVFK